MKDTDNLYQDIHTDHPESHDQEKKEIPQPGQFTYQQPYAGQQAYYQPYPPQQPQYYNDAAQGYPQNMAQQQPAQPVYYQPQQAAYNTYQQAPQYFPQGYIQPVINPYMAAPSQAQPQQTDHSDHDHETDAHTDDHPGQEKIPKFDEHKYGQFMDILNDLASGNPPEMSKVMEFMNGTDTQFLKGAAVGAAGVFLMTNETVKSAAVNMVAKIMNAFGKAQ